MLIWTVKAIKRLSDNFHDFTIQSSYSTNSQNVFTKRTPFGYRQLAKYRQRFFAFS